MTSVRLPGGFLSLSASGSITGTVIVWASHPTTDGVHTATPGALRAYDAANVGDELWNSTQNAARDSVGNFAKFNPPTVPNGRVYLETFSNQPIAYGIMGAPGIITQPMSQTIVSGQSATLSTVVTGQAPLSYQWYRGSSGDNQNPVGVNADSFNTPPLAVDTRYWVRASNPLGYVDSATALVATARLIFLPLLAN